MINHLIDLQGGGTLNITHNEILFPNINLSFHPFLAGMHGSRGCVKDCMGTIILHCGNQTDATIIANALNFWAETRLIDGAADA